MIIAWKKMKKIKGEGKVNKNKKDNFDWVKVLGLSIGMTLIFWFVNPVRNFVLADKEQGPEKKSYAFLKPMARHGEPPEITIGVPLQDEKTKSGKIPIKVEIPGVWRSKKKMNERLYHLVEIPTGSYTTEVGAPMVSTISLEVEIPTDAKFKELEGKAVLMGKFENVTLAPVQEPLPVITPIKRDEGFIQKKQEFVINKDIYLQTSPYPGYYWQVITDSFMGDRHIIIVKVFPIQFYPAAKIIKIYSLEMNILFTKK